MNRFAIGIAGILVILAIAVALSTDRRAIRPRVVGAAFALQAGIAFLVLYVPAGRAAIEGMAKGVSALLGPFAGRGIDRHGGRPVLVVPEGARLMVPPRRVVLAWQPRREPSRAIHDALPLLPRDARVDVLVLDPEVGEFGHGQQPGADIAAHLARHGAQVQVVTQSREGRSTGAVIVDYATAQHAELIVMGGYGHSRWREQVLGGATRAVLAQSGMPVLFAH